MTLLKAYLLGTNDPFVLAKVFYEDILLKDFAAIDDEIDKILGFEWKEYYDLTVQDIDTTKLELEDIEHTLTDWEEELESLIEQIKEIESGPSASQYTTDDPTELTTYPGSEYNLVQEVEDFETELSKLYGVAKELSIKIKEDEKFLKILLQERNNVAKKLSGFTHDEMFDPEHSSLLFDAKYEIHQLGLSLLNKEKKLLDDLTTGELAEIMKLPPIEEIQNLWDNYKKFLLTEKSHHKKIEAWKELEEKIKGYDAGESGGIGKQRKHRNKLRIINAKIKNSKNSLKELESTQKGKESSRLAEQAVKDFKLGPNEKLLPTLGYQTYKRVLETTDPETKKVTRKLLNKYKWNSETKQLEEVKEQVKEKYEGPFKTPEEIGTFSSDKFWESFIGEQKGSNVGIKNALKMFLEEYEEEGKGELELKPKPTTDDDYGININLKEGTDKDNQRDRQIKLSNLNTLKNIFESFEEPLKNNRSVNYILEIIQKNIDSLTEKLLPDSKKKEEKGYRNTIINSYKKLATIIRKAYEEVARYDGGKYSKEFIIEVKKLKRIIGFEQLDIMSLDAPEEGSEEYKKLGKPHQLMLNSKTYKEINKYLNKKGLSKQKLITHIDNVWESEELENYGKMSQKVRDQLQEQMGILEGEFSKKKKERELGIEGASKKKKQRLSKDYEDDFITKLDEFKEKIEEYLDSEGNVDEDLTTTEIRDISQYMEKMNNTWEQIKLNYIIHGKNTINNKIKDIRKITSKLLNQEQFEENTLPDEKMEYLSSLSLRLQREVDDWLNDRNSMFIDKEGNKWSKSQVRTYVNQAIPTADESLINPRVKSEFKTKIMARIKKERNTLINKIMLGFSVSGVKGSQIKGKDLSWIIEQMGSSKQMIGEYDEPKPRFRPQQDLDAPTYNESGSSELSQGEAEEAFGELQTTDKEGKIKYGKSKGYEESGDSARERAANAAQQREELKEIYGED